MTRDQAVLMAVGGLGVVCVVLVVALVRVRGELAAVQQRLDDRDHLHENSAPTAPTAPTTPTPTPAAAPVEFVITDLGREQGPVEPTRLDGAAFADIVLKETVVKAASFAHGVRRGLAPATRNRIRFEMRQEVRRARKQRRADLKSAQRDRRARQRAALAEEAS